MRKNDDIPPCLKNEVTLKQVFHKCASTLKTLIITPDNRVHRGIMATSFNITQKEDEISPRLQICLFREAKDNKYQLVARLILPANQVCQLKGFIEYLPQSIIKIPEEG